MNPAISYTFSEIDISSFYRRGFLRLYVYCASIADKGHNCTIELTSSGQCDVEEITFDVSPQIKETGWNEVIVELSTSSSGSPGTTFDKTRCNFFRFYVLDSNCYYYVDDIDFLYATENEDKIILNECENTTNLTGASLNNFSMYGDYCW